MMKKNFASALVPGCIIVACAAEPLQLDDETLSLLDAPYLDPKR